MCCLARYRGLHLKEAAEIASSNEIFDTLDLSRLIDPAKTRGLVDAVVSEGQMYSVEMGAAKFLLDAARTREF